jgi:molecular chaperone DnaK (HSP70)
LRKVLLALLMLLVLTGCKQNEIGKHAIVLEVDTPAIDRDGNLTESVGIETLGGVFTPIIYLGAKVPFDKSEVFSTAEDNQTQIGLSIFRGTGALAQDNKRLAKCRIVGFQPAPRGVPQIKVTFQVTRKDIRLYALDLATGTLMTISLVDSAQ